MLSGSDVTSEIASQVNEATADKVTVSLASTPTDGGTLSLSISQAEKVSIPFPLTATANDTYAFTSWSVTGGGKVSLSSTTISTALTESSTTVTIGSAASDIVITANFTARPTVAFSLADYQQLDVSRTEPVSFTFSKPMDMSTLTPSNIAITGKYSSIPGNTTDCSSFFTLTKTSTTLTLTPNGSDGLPALYAIFITISQKMHSSDGIPLAADVPVYYITGE
jgi:hypothetical protein